LDSLLQTAQKMVNTLTCTIPTQQQDCNTDNGRGTLWYWSRKCSNPTVGFICSGNMGGRCQCPDVSFPISPLFPADWKRHNLSPPSDTIRDQIIWTLSQMRTIDSDIRTQIASLSSRLNATNAALAAANAQYAAALNDYQFIVTQYQFDITELSSIMRQEALNLQALFSAIIVQGNAQRELAVGITTRDVLTAQLNADEKLLLPQIQDLARQNEVTADMAVQEMSIVNCGAAADCTDGGGAMDFFSVIRCYAPTFVCGVGSHCTCPTSSPSLSLSRQSINRVPRLVERQPPTVHK